MVGFFEIFFLNTVAGPPGRAHAFMEALGGEGASRIIIGPYPPNVDPLTELDVTAVVA